MKKINIKGPIIRSDDQWIYDYFGIEAVSPKNVSKLIDEASGDELEVEINSGGGDVFSGSEIYTALKSYQGNVIVKIVGLAASAASVIAMAGKKVVMSPTAQMMIHNVSSMASGDHRDMAHASEVLKNANDTIANAYRLKSGKSQKELLDLMNKESWFTAQQALDNKLIDEVMFSNSSFVASFGINELLPEEVINKIRNSIKNPLSNEADILMHKKAEATLKYYELIGGIK